MKNKEEGYAAAEEFDTLVNRLLKEDVRLEMMLDNQVARLNQRLGWLAFIRTCRTTIDLLEREKALMGARQ